MMGAGQVSHRSQIGVCVCQIRVTDREHMLYVCVSSVCQMGEARCCVRQIGVVEGIQHAVCVITLVSERYQTGVR